MTGVEKRGKRKMEESKRWWFRKSLKRNKIQKRKKKAREKACYVRGNNFMLYRAPIRLPVRTLEVKRSKFYSWFFGEVC